MIKLKEILEMFNLWLFPTRACCPSCKDYYRQVLTFVPGGVAVVAFIALLSLLPYKIGLRPNTGINSSWQNELTWHVYWLPIHIQVINTLDVLIMCHWFLRILDSIKPHLSLNTCLTGLFSVCMKHLFNIFFLSEL